ncbi:MAG: SDR family oxidoreductase [Anaerolineae bacterium]|jgi:3-oxoacyl-[acyl-carrier protein] reductase
MDLGLDDKIALVAASSRGLGRAVALRLAQEGAHVTICARGQRDLISTADDIRRATGQRALAIAADIADPQAASALVEATLQEFGRLDILVTNAGGPPPGEFLDFTAQDWEDAAQLTLMSAVRLCRAAAPVMKDQGSGSILAMTSITTKQPLPNLVLSNSVRLAVTGLAKTLADELAPYGIRVNALCPGWTRTARVDQLLEDRARRNGTSVEEEAAKIAADIPLGRMGTPEEFAAAAVFLVSEAASFINGVSLLVDGGMHRGVM